MEGELCIDINLEWDSTFDTLLVQFSFRKKLYGFSKKQLLDNALIRL